MGSLGLRVLADVVEAALELSLSELLVTGLPTEGLLGGADSVDVEQGFAVPGTSRLTFQQC